MIEVIECPSCGCQNLHHTTVDVFQRATETAPDTHVRVGNGITVDQDVEENPSSRRNGLTIRLWCEECSEIALMSIEQHKGTTFLRLERVEPNAEDTALETAMNAEIERVAQLIESDRAES